MSRWIDERMHRREALGRMAAGAAGLGAGSFPGVGAVSGARRPNVVIIYTDDQNFFHIGCYGGAVHTPHQDGIAREGIMFRRGYVTTGVCTPSRYSCLTGEYPGRCRARIDPPGKQLEVSFNTNITREQPTIAKVLKAAGYTTGMVGKWGLGGAEGVKRLQRTDAWLARDGEPDPRDPAVSEQLRHNHDCFRREIQSRGFDYAESIYPGNPEGWAVHSLNIHNMEWVVDGALKFIEQNRDRPFFLYFSPTLHHIPHPQESLLQADPRITGEGYLDRAPDVMPPRDGVMQRAVDAGYEPETAYCTWFDDGIGAVLGKLDELGLARDTLVLFVSDNGTPAKGTIYEGGVNVPFMARWPGRIPAGTVSDGLVQNIDLAATVFDACGVTPPADMNMDGVSILPVLLGERRNVRDELFFEIGWTRAICTDRWKYLAIRYSADAREELAQGKRLYHNRALEPHQHNVLLNHPNFWDPDQLYDLSVDYDEVVNMAFDARHSDTLADLQDRLGRWLATFGDHPFGEFTG